MPRGRCAYRVGQRCFSNLGYPEDVATTPASERLTVRLRRDTSARENPWGVQSLMNQVQEALSAAQAARADRAQPTVLLVDVTDLALNVSAECAAP